MVTKQGVPFRNAFETAKDLVGYATLFFNSTGMHIMELGPAQNLIVNIWVCKDRVCEYECTKATSFGVDVPYLFRLLQSVNTQDIITVLAEEGVTDSFKLIIDSPNAESQSEIDVPTLEINSDAMQIPNVKYDCTARLPSEYFQRYVNELHNAAVDRARLMVDEKREFLTMTGKGDFATLKRRIRISGNRVMTKKKGKSNPDTDDESESEEGEENTVVAAEHNAQDSFSCGPYSIRYLKMFCRATSLSPVVTLFMKADYVIIVRYDIAELGEMKFVLGQMTDE